MFKMCFAEEKRTKLPMVNQLQGDISRSHIATEGGNQLARVCRFLSFLLFCSLILPCVAVAEQATLLWDANSESDLDGYKVYWGTKSRTEVAYPNKSNLIAKSANPSFLLANLAPNTRYYVAATALDTSNNQSDFSLELSFTTGNGSNGADTDKDGLSDADEATLGTDPLNPDTDNDGVKDGQEVSDGTNPRDPGSVISLLNTSLCTEWNGNFGMFNFYEHVNLGNKLLNVAIKLYDLNGVVQDSDNFQLNPGIQTDYPVHAMNGFSNNTFGKVCSSHDGNPGDMDGRMVHYLQDGNSPNAFQYAFAMPVSNGRMGSQFVPFNTFQPSLDGGDESNLVANWIQITNLSDESARGRLFFYGMDGSPLGDSAGTLVTLNAGERRDTAAHEFGGSIVGMVEWRPDSNALPFMVRNIRYLYDNPGAVNSFDTAFQVEAGHGSGELLVAPLDTRSSSSIIEVLNTSSSAVTAQVDVYSKDGTLVTTLQLTEAELPARGSFHIITDPILGPGVQGVATIKGSALSSIMAVVMQYRRSATLGIEYMYGVTAQQAVGSVVRGSYNTFIQQDSKLLIANSTGAAQGLSLSMVRFDGTQVVSGSGETIAPYGLLDINLSSFEEESDTYGLATLLPDTPNSVAGWVLRERGLDYVIVTPVRQ